MDTKNPRGANARASVSITADAQSLTKNHRNLQADATLPPPYVAFFQGPDGRNDRFMVQGLIDRHQIGCAAQVLINLLDVIEGDADFERTDAEDDFVEREGTPCDGPGCEIGDPGGQCDEDDRNTAFGLTLANDTPGCAISDPGEYEDGV